MARTCTEHNLDKNQHNILAQRSEPSAYLQAPYSFACWRKMTHGRSATSPSTATTGLPPLSKPASISGPWAMSFAISVQRARRVRVGLKPAFVKTAIRYLPGKSKTLGLCAQVAPNDEFMAPARVLGVDIAANAPMVVRSAGDGCARTWAWAWAWHSNSTTMCIISICTSCN
jgi:hypothetical protein